MTSARPLRIAVFAPHFSEYSMRLAVALSAQSSVLLITEARNFASECGGLAFHAPQTLVRTVYQSNYTLRRLSARGFLESRRIRRLLRAFRPDVVHIQEQGDRFTVAIANEVSRSVPIVLTVHDPVPHSGSDALVAQRFAAGLIRLRRLASAYHVHGAHCEALLRRTVDTSRPITATAHGVILVPSTEQLVDRKDRYLFFGRMEAYKGLDTLLDAIDLLPEAEGFRFVFAGRGPELERHRARIAACPCVEVIDRFLSPPEAIFQFQRARAILVPYRDATQSGVVSAAVGNGRPVIATRVGGLMDAVENGANGLVVPPDDPPALAAAIRAFADARMGARLAAGARSAAAARFAWSTIATQLHTLYAQVLAERGGGMGLESRPHP